MVIHKEFIWLHLGKTGGTTVGDIFEQCQFPEVEELVHRCPQQHWTVSQYERQRRRPLQGRDIILSIRPLVPWMQSHQCQKERYSMAPFEKDRFLKGYIPYRNKQGDGFDWRHADALLARFLEPKPGRFIRQPHLADDFVRVFGRYFEFTADDLEIINAIHENQREGPVPEHLRLEPAEEALMGRNCPLWTKIVARAEAAHDYF